MTVPMTPRSPASTEASPPRLKPWAASLMLAALLVPSLWGVGAPPLVTFGIDNLAMLGWGVALAWMAPALCGAATGAALRRADAAWWGVLAAWAVLLGCVGASLLFLGLPLAIGSRHGGVLLAAAVALWCGARLARALATDAQTMAPGAASSPASELAKALLACFVFTGLAHAAIAVLQSAGIDGWWPALNVEGRAGGGFAQPNLLGTQLLWAYAALAALRAGGQLSSGRAIPIAALLIVALALSASRTAFVASVVLAGWGLLDARLGRAARSLLVALPPALALSWAGLYAWKGIGFAGTALLQKADPTSSRWGLWQQCAKLIAENPWFGVGWGQFNFAWTLTPMPGLPRTAGYMFNHAHNLFIHWAVEIGLPLTCLLAALFGFALWRGVQRLWRADGDRPLLPRAAVAMVAVVAVHSQLEFPLWWVNFLLPAAFLFGLAIPVLVPVNALAAATRWTGRSPRWAMVPGCLMALAAILVWADHRALHTLYRPSEDAPPEHQRIVDASQSLLFGQFGDRFVGTLAPNGRRRTEPFQAVVFEGIDDRLLASWALAQAEVGRIDKARYLVARLREFNTPTGRYFMALCTKEPHRFQCLPGEPTLSFRDFR